MGPTGQTYFSHGDWLGTERARTDKAGATTETCTNLPFGDAQTCTGTSVSPLHFTGKQRDTETDNDYFGARYYVSRQGRWLTPDWSARAEAVPYASLANPQTLNLYAYVGNNPVSTADADGHFSSGSYQKNGEFIAGWQSFPFDITTSFSTNPSSLFDAAVQQHQARLATADANRLADRLARAGQSQTNSQAGAGCCTITLLSRPIKVFFLGWFFTHQVWDVVTDSEEWVISGQKNKHTGKLELQKLKIGGANPADVRAELKGAHVVWQRSGPDLASQANAMTHTEMDPIRYHVFGINSNSVVRTLGVAVGITSIPRPHGAVGWSRLASIYFQ